MGVVAGLEDGHPTNTGMLDSDVDLIILLGRGVMYDLDRILSSTFSRQAQGYTFFFFKYVYSKVCIPVLKTKRVLAKFNIASAREIYVDT